MILGISLHPRKTREEATAPCFDKMMRRVEVPALDPPQLDGDECRGKHSRNFLIGLDV